MNELTREKLNKVLEEHKHWINEDCTHFFKTVEIEVPYNEGEE